MLLLANFSQESSRFAFDFYPLRNFRFLIGLRLRQTNDIKNTAFSLFLSV